MSHRASSSKSAGKPNFMQQLFAHNRKKSHRQTIECKRSRSRLLSEEPSPTPTIICTSTGIENNQNNTRDFSAVESNEQPLKDEIIMNTNKKQTSSCEEEEKSSSIAAYHQRVASYLRCHHQAWHHENGYRVVSRLQAKHEDDGAASNTKPRKDDPFATRGDSYARTTTMTSTSTSDWTTCLPRLLLIILLNVECHDIMEARSSRPSYEELLAELVAERQDRQNLALEYDKIVDRFARFKRYVESTKEKYLRVAERQQQRAAVASRKETQSTRPSSSSSEHGVAAAPLLVGHQSTPASFSTSSRIPSHQSTSGVTSLSAGSPYAAPQADRAASAAVEVTPGLSEVPNQKRKNPRRVTASPARILSHLPQPSSGPPTNSSKVRKIDASSSPSRRPEAFVESSSAAPLAKPKASPVVVSSYRTSVPNPFPKEAPGPSPSTADPAATCHDDSQTIIPPPRPAPQKRKKLPQEESTNSNNKPAVAKHVETHKVGSGWISSRPAKAFVGELDNTKKSRPRTSLPAPFKPKGIAHRLTTKKKNPPNPYENDDDEDDEDDDFLDGSSNSPPQEGPYVEVVRKKVDRQRLQPFQCEECGKFLDAICEADSQGVYDRHALLCHSRHRAKFVSDVPATPDDFWELSFMDELDAKRRQAAEAAGGDNDEDDSSEMDEKPKAKDNK